MRLLKKLAVSPNSHSEVFSGFRLFVRLAVVFSQSQRTVQGCVEVSESTGDMVGDIGMPMFCIHQRHYRFVPMRHVL